MKKTIAILLACMTLVLCAVSAYAGYEIYDVQPQANCCSKFSGYATEILHHTKLGGSCIAECQYYCPSCGRRFDKWTETNSMCTHRGLGNF